MRAQKFAKHYREWKFWVLDAPILCLARLGAGKSLALWQGCFTRIARRTWKICFLFLFGRPEFDHLFAVFFGTAADYWGRMDCHVSSLPVERVLELCVRCACLQPTTSKYFTCAVPQALASNAVAIAPNLQTFGLWFVVNLDITMRVRSCTNSMLIYY